MITTSVKCVDIPWNERYSNPDHPRPATWSPDLFRGKGLAKLLGPECAQIMTEFDWSTQYCVISAVISAKFQLHRTCRIAAMDHVYCRERESPPGVVNSSSSKLSGRPLCAVSALIDATVFSVSFRENRHRESIYQGLQSTKRHSCR